jgi:hypothetical protein
MPICDQTRCGLTRTGELLDRFEGHPAAALGGDPIPAGASARPFCFVRAGLLPTPLAGELGHRFSSHSRENLAVLGEVRASVRVVRVFNLVNSG